MNRWQKKRKKKHLKYAKLRKRHQHMYTISNSSSSEIEIYWRRTPPGHGGLFIFLTPLFKRVLEGDVERRTLLPYLPSVIESLRDSKSKHLWTIMRIAVSRIGSSSGSFGHRCWPIPAHVPMVKLLMAQVIILDLRHFVLRRECGIIHVWTFRGPCGHWWVAIAVKLRSGTGPGSFLSP